MSILLGILPKCETKHEDMIANMEHIQDYVPVHSEKTNVDVPGVGEKKCLLIGITTFYLVMTCSLPGELSTSMVLLLQGGMIRLKDYCL